MRVPGPEYHALPSTLPDVRTVAEQALLRAELELFPPPAPEPPAPIGNTQVPANPGNILGL